MTTSRKADIIGRLYQAGAVKIDFTRGWTLVSGIWTPIYVDFRLLQSDPKLLQTIAYELRKLTLKKKLKYDRIASIPLGGVPLGIALSLTTGKPHVMPRLDNKQHGLGAKINGTYKKGERILVVDDLVTKATSKFEAVKFLAAAGLKVRDILVVLDREQGGREALAAQKLKLYALFTFDYFLASLLAQKKITPTVYKKIIDYLKKAKA